MPRTRDLSAALLRLPVADAPYAFVDVETTGLYPWTGDRVCEIAVVRCQGNTEIGRLATLVNPLRPISPGAYSVNGISPALLVGAPTFAQIAREVHDALDGCVLVAHNAGFDVGFLARELSLAGQPYPRVRVVDTLALARRHLHLKRNSLAALATAFGIGETAHRALGDALAVREVFHRLTRQLLPAGARVSTLIRLQGVSIDWPAAPSESESLGAHAEAIAVALLDGRRLLIAYTSKTGEQTERLVDPLELANREGEPCLVAFCHLRNEQRTFFLRRIASLTVVTEATE